MGYNPGQVAPVAQWIERCPPEAEIGVRIAAGAPSPLIARNLKELNFFGHGIDQRITAGSLHPEKFTWVEEETVTHLLEVLEVIMTVTHQIIESGMGKAACNLRVMVYSNREITQGKLCKGPM